MVLRASRREGFAASACLRKVSALLLNLTITRAESGISSLRVTTSCLVSADPAASIASELLHSVKAKVTRMALCQCATNQCERVIVWFFDGFKLTINRYPS
jgi:hypothetical protein